MGCESPTRRPRGSSPSARRSTTSWRTRRRPPAESRPPGPLETLRELLDELPEDLARQAVSHASWVDRRSQSWDRLAFLGDAVLGLAVSTDIFPRFPRFGAGRLTKLRAQAVSRQACAEVARDLGLPERMADAAPPGRDADVLTRSERILASVCEAVIGAAYLEFGFERVAPAVAKVFEPQIQEALAHPVDFKSVLQERLARRGKTVTYRIDAEEGPPHQRSFVAVAEVSGVELGRGEGRTKKAAEQEAAWYALGAPGSAGASEPDDEGDSLAEPAAVGDHAADGA